MTTKTKTKRCDICGLTQHEADQRELGLGWLKARSSGVYAHEACADDEDVD